MKLPLTKIAVIYLTGIFLVGAVAGGAVGYSYSSKNRLQWRNHRPEDMARHLEDRVAEDLRLDAIQREKFRPYFDDLAKEMGKLHRDGMRQIQGVMNRFHERIRAELRPDQLELLEKKRLELERRCARDGKPSGPPPTGRPH